MSSTADATATTDLPSGDPVPSSAAPAPHHHPHHPKPEPRTLRALLATAPSNADAFLAHVQRCLQTPSGIDTCLLFLCYTSRLGSAALETLTRPALARSAERLVALASALPPSATLIFTTAALPSRGAALALRLARRLKAFSVMLSDARAFLRLWGLLGMYFWFRRLVAAAKLRRSEEAEKPSSSSSSPDKVETALAWAQLSACVVFQALENGAYLSSKGVLGWAPATQGRAGRWSARFWAAFVGMEIGRLFYESHRRGRRTRAEKLAGGKTVAEVEREEREWSDNWRKTLVRQLAWAPLTVHWSLDQGILSELGIGLLASIPGTIQMRDLWRRAAEE
ncbi:hypothetical protein F4779DRAFT_639112 [Xylariaceae sp. FL0662B]|nr:hypothetical protein F4779DRAFT_639112 [Xylariaceae sp. FL0662B]